MGKKKFLDGLGPNRPEFFWFVQSELQTVWAQTVWNFTDGLGPNRPEFYRRFG
jgi:hypothetical protein